MPPLIPHSHGSESMSTSHTSRRDYSRVSAHSRLRVAALVVLTFVATPRQATAQFTWNNAAGGDWLSAGNWTPAGGPPNAVGATAIFGNVVTSVAPITISGGSVTVGELNMSGTSAAWGYSIGQAGNTITLNDGRGAGTLSTDPGIVSTNTSPIL